MDSAVVGDLLPRDKRRSQPAVVFPTADREMSYRDFITTAYKSGNVLRYMGLGSEATLAIDPVCRPEPLLAFLGAAQLGATTTFDPTADARVRLVPAAAEADYLDAAGQLTVFGGSPEASGTTHWEKAVWSENPAFPPTQVDPDATVLDAGDAQYTHRELLGMADQVVTELDLDTSSRLAIRTSLSAPETIGGGLLAALLGGATAVFVQDSEIAVEADAALVDDTAAAQSVPEPTWLSVATLRE